MWEEDREAIDETDGGVILTITEKSEGCQLSSPQGSFSAHHPLLKRDVIGSLNWFASCFWGLAAGYATGLLLLLCIKSNYTQLFINVFKLHYLLWNTAAWPGHPTFWWQVRHHFPNQKSYNETVSLLVFPKLSSGHLLWMFPAPCSYTTAMTQFGTSPPSLAGLRAS